MCDCHTEITRLKAIVAMEKLKTKLYKQIIEQKLDIKLDDRTEEIINEMLCKKLRVEPDIQRQPNIQCQNQSQSQVAKKVYKSLPKSLEIQEEPNGDISQELIKIATENTLKSYKDVFGEFDVKICTDDIKTSFESLKETRAYNQLLLNIRKSRTCFHTVLNITEYISVVETHIAKLKSIFLEKGFNERKIVGLYPNFLSPLEYRLLQVEGFEKKTIESDDIEKFKFSMKIGADYAKTYRPFDQTHFLHYVLSYSLCLFPLKDIVETFINNPYGFKNIIYVPMISDEGAYSFYVLNRIENTKRCWKMDCRLDTLTTELTESVKNYSANLFRKIYKKCLNTNNYIAWENCSSKFQVLEFDCTQLLRNLFTCMNFIRANEIVKQSVQTHCVKQPTTNDKFDLYNDDKEKLMQMKEYKIEQQDIIEIIKLLFDDIDDPACLEFYRAIDV